MFTFWQASTFGTILVYGIMVDSRVLYIWLAFLAGYLLLGYLQGYSHLNSIRKKIRIGTWNPPTDPNCYVKIEVNLAAVVCSHQADAFIREKEKEGVRVTYTNIGLKSLGEGFNAHKKEHGKIVFGR